MMHRPSVPELLKPGQSYYSLVVAVAKRAREIAQQADENGDILLEKPVKMAVDDFAKGRYKLVESDDIGVIRDRKLSYVPTTSLEDEE
ncbi:MAG: DNA-directed RNA polymerase subunit omega [Candidatus Merdivicinus sp.]|jgi:DNA-directed RNA polymerase subunit omega